MLNRVTSGRVHAGPVEPGSRRVEPAGLDGATEARTSDSTAADGVSEIAESDVREAIGEIAKSLTSAADKFKMLTANPFSLATKQHVSQEIQSKVKPSFEALSGFLSVWGQAASGAGSIPKSAAEQGAVQELGKTLDKNIEDWGKAIREEAKLSRKKAEKDDIRTSEIDRSEQLFQDRREV